MSCSGTEGEACQHCTERTERALKAAAIAVVLNLLLSFLLQPFASRAEIKPPAGAHKLSYKSRLMHLFVHHAQIPLTSSIMVAVIVGASVYAADIIPK